MDGMETITVYCCNHQCVRNHRCARYTRNHKLVGMKIVKRYNCQGGENQYEPYLIQIGFDLVGLSFVENEWNTFKFATAPDVLKISLKIVGGKAFLRMDYQKKPKIYEMAVEDINAFDFSKFWELERRFKKVQDKIDDIEKDFG